MTDSPIVALSNVSKHYGEDSGTVVALDDITLAMPRGSFMAVVGASGSGKSTLLSILGLLDVATTGQHRFNGEEMGGTTRRERARLRADAVGFVFQAYNLISELTVIENVIVPLRYQGRPKQERIARAREALVRVGLQNRSEFYPAELSGGQQQRAAIARAIAGDPSLLLADEPTGSLDTANGTAIMELLGALNQQGTTICLVTHDLACAHHATSGIELSDGRIVRAW